jgi:hypothetical protein
VELTPLLRRARDHKDRYHADPIDLDELARVAGVIRGRHRRPGKRRLPPAHRQHPSQPELELTLMTPGSPLDAEFAGHVRRQLEKGQMGGIGLRVDDCRKTVAELLDNGVVLLQEPVDP